MSQADDLFTPRDATTATTATAAPSGPPPTTAMSGPAARPSFVVALRGYDKRQVDHYVSQVDSELSALAAGRERAHRQARDLAARLELVQAELTELRQRPPEIARASFRDLGPTVDQILALAEKQAAEITDAAAQRAADHQAEAERVLADARQLADRLRADSEAAHERAEQEAQRIHEQSTQQLADARAEAEALLDAAREQTQQEIQARQQALAQLHAELDTTERQLAQSRREGAAVEREVAQLQQRLGELGQELAAEFDRLKEARRAADTAERHAVDVRARVQREAERVAQLAAAAVMAAAARGTETGEYPMVVSVQPSGNGTAEPATEPPADRVAPDPMAAADGSGHASQPGHPGLAGQHTGEVTPPLRGPQPGEVPADAG